MRNFKIAMCVLTMGLASSYVHAADLKPGQGTVEFNGLLIDETCEIDPESKNVQVTLPTLSTKTLASVGTEGGSKAFEIKLIKCPASIKNVAANFDVTGENSGINSVTGNLVNNAPTADAAKNVEVRLYDTDMNQMAVGVHTGEGKGTFPVATDGSATLRYFGGYYATGATTSGKVHAKTQYTLSYP